MRLETIIETTDNREVFFMHNNKIELGKVIEIKNNIDKNVILLQLKLQNGLLQTRNYNDCYVDKQSLFDSL